MDHKESIAQLIATVLDGTELHFHVDSYRIEENLESGPLTVQCNIHDERSGNRSVITGSGVGAIDAMFVGIVNVFANEFPSLKSLRVVDFSIKTDVNSGKQATRSDMAAIVTLIIANSEGREYSFSHASQSTTHSSLAVVLQCTEFFINSERAFISVYKALQHARENNRPDSVTLYTSQLATLVEATSYSEVIEQIRSTELKK
ncbi:MAG: hypothetical protein JW841_03775 [Deltaproteobacteria bacterium]|nr:hypothetical protein [Deltaproteobacteria bacterium]